ncbi:ComEC/Rec2 family competence protein [Cellulosimicrobium marinum]|uniref:ComEC/Rec2 family competence protein n=1 Tax=Cellulosimicrobium marinum TaxID=1638992 RepID=UPI001E3F9051|nr:ComEC/Rec2 family competence protein [Cellulosimicrobium marinum]MCB7135393.1 ComEC/Rec2 family competence protein [Cellulosimicrobium marinum]
MTDLRLAPAALVAWAVAACAVGAEPDVVLVAAGVTAVLLGGVLVVAAVRRLRPASGDDDVRSPVRRAARRLPWGQAVLVAACAGAVLLSCGAQLAARAGAATAELAADGATATVVAVPTSAVEPRTNPWTGAVDQHEVRVGLRTLTARGVTTAATGPVLLRGGGHGWDGIAYGATVEARGQLRLDGDRTVLQVDHAPRVLTEPPALLRGVHALRSGLLDRTDGLSPQARGLVPGVAVGDTSRLDPDLDDALRTTSLTHVTAVSGGHFAIVVACVAALCVVLRAPRTVRVVVTAAAMTGFVLLVHPEPSVLRAAAMGAVGLVGLLLGRPSRAVAALGAAVVVLLVLDPWLARSYGFVLSVAATAGLALGAGPIARRLEPWCGRATAHLVAVPVAAQAACGPVLVLLDPGLSTYGVLANLVAAPALGPATVLGLVATLLAPVWPAASTVVAAGAGLFTGWIAAVATTFAALPGARTPWPGGPGGLLLLAVVTAVALVLVLRSRTLDRLGDARLRDRAHRPPWTVRLRRVRGARLSGRSTRSLGSGRARGALVVTALVAALVLAFLLVRPATTLGTRVPDDWAVVACDVGQGDALVLRSGESSAVVVDVGPDGPAAGRCLDTLGVDTVDLLVLSHFHADHVGGLDRVLQGRRVTGALVTATRDPAAQADRTLGALAAAGVRVDVAQAGATGVAGTGADGVAWEVLQAGPATGGTAWEGGANDASVVLRAQVGAVDVVALGDLEDPGQEALARTLAARGADPVDVVKMAHHGSRVQSDRLAGLLAPSVVLVSAGENTYGHPTDHALDLYRSVGATVLRTDRCGTVALVAHDDGLAVPGCADGS